MYLAIAWRSFRRYATYRAATAAGVFTNTVFGVVLAYTYIALWHAHPGVGGYDMRAAVTYVWLGQAMLATTEVFGGPFVRELAERVRKGDIAVDLYRPVDMQAWYLASDAGRAAFSLLARGAVPTAFGALVFGFRWPHDPAVWFAYPVAIALAVIVSYGLRFLVVLSGFWLLDSQGVDVLAGALGIFMSGMLLPLTVFPAGLGEVARVLPWSALLQVPADVFLGRYHGVALLGALGFQALWAVVLLAVGRLTLLLATRKVVVQGG
ncbi:MAG: ABC-2 family transporter protein [Streptosporangiales bacterium]|nr:ABC-2 family transporter protein [Streptosporangiales bacterium]MBO0892086.1 ABC-2 family transporter protein [Acidothermales bacterium]